MGRGPRTVDHRPRTVDRGPTDYGLRITDYGLRTTDYGLRTTDYGLQTCGLPTCGVDCAHFRHRSCDREKTGTLADAVYTCVRFIRMAKKTIAKPKAAALSLHLGLNAVDPVHYGG